MLVLRPDGRTLDLDRATIVHIYTIVRNLGDHEPGCPILEIIPDTPSAPDSDAILVGKVEYYGGPVMLWYWDDRFWTPMILDDYEMDEEHWK
jgi:hypothetical protein